MVQIRALILKKQRNILVLEGHRDRYVKTRDELITIRARVNEKIKKYQEGMNDKDQEKVQQYRIKKINQRIKLVQRNNTEVEAALSDFCTEYFPAFEVAELRRRRQSKIEHYFRPDKLPPSVKFVPLLQILNELLQKASGPDPYIEISEVIWFPYVELLLHAQIIEKDTLDSSYIRLVQFNK